jgi:hypothetical protein
VQHQQPRHHTKLTIGLICLFLSHGLANSTVIVVAGNHTAGFYGDVLGLPTRLHSGILVFSQGSRQSTIGGSRDVDQPGRAATVVVGNQGRPCRTTIKSPWIGVNPVPSAPR